MASELRAIAVHGGAGIKMLAACEGAIRGRFSSIAGSGGATAIDASGNLGMCFDSAVMHRVWKVGNQVCEAEIR